MIPVQKIVSKAVEPTQPSRSSSAAQVFCVAPALGLSLPAMQQWRGILLLLGGLSLWISLLPTVESFTASSAFLGSRLSESSHHYHHPRPAAATQLSMMFDQLTSAISSVVSDTFQRQRMTENNLQPALQQVRRALLDADVNLQVADTLIAGVKERSLGQKVSTAGVSARDQFVKAMYDELVQVMGGDDESNSVLVQGKKGKPAVLLLAGLQGAGKTTAAAKLALYLKEREVIPTDDGDGDAPPADDVPLSQQPKTNRNVLLVAADVYRPAAIDQLQILGKQIGVTVFARPNSTDPVAICKAAVLEAKKASPPYDTVLIDTAGRQVLDANLMQELGRIQKAVRPDETLLVMDAMTGQEAARLAAAFPDVTGAVLTKLDGDARGGAAVSVRGVSGKPIRFVGTGEKVKDLEPFYPDRMASRILGMGDVVSLVERAAEAVSKEDAQAMQQRMVDATFDFDDFLKQSEMVNQMGNMANLVKMLPGIGNKVNAGDIQNVEKRLKKSKAMICSMTNKERKNPELLIKDRTARSRLIRITKGSGTTLTEGMQFISEFQKMKTMMSRMQKMGSAEAAAEAEGEPAGLAGNRAKRRAAKKNKRKLGRGGGGGFG